MPIVTANGHQIRYEIEGPVGAPVIAFKGPMRVIALIDDPQVVRRILEHLGLWAPEASGPGPPVPAPVWPANAVIPLTYHPVPDIA